jgi:hypothetical protein
MAALHSGALLIILLIDIPFWVKVLMSLGLLVSLVDVFRKVVLRNSGAAVTAVELDSDDNLKLIYQNGEMRRASRLHSVFVHPLMTLLTVAIDGSRLKQKIVIPFDAVDPNKFREIRVRLKRIKIG